MKQLLVYRHAKTEGAGPDGSDHSRVLRPDGVDTARKTGTRIAKRGLAPERIVSSDAVRAVTTAEITAEACGYQNEIVTMRELYDGTTETYLRVIRYCPDTITRFMIVGHNPSIESLIETLVERYVQVRTGALVYLVLPISNWTELGPGTEYDILEVIR